MQPSRCLNCDASVGDGFKYCPHCAQAVHQHRLNLTHLIHEIVHFFTHADKGIFFLFRKLATQPGIVAKEYVEGKRKKYFPPLNFYLIVAGLVVFATATFHRPAESGRVRSFQQMVDRTKDPVLREKLGRMGKRMQTVTVVTSKYSNVIAMLATPLLTVLLWLFYAKGKYNYTEHLVANLYFTGFTNTVYAFVFVPLNAAFQSVSNLFLMAFFLFEVSYRSVAYYQFIGKPGFAGKLKAVAASLFVIGLWIGLVFFIIRHYIGSGLWGLFN